MTEAINALGRGFAEFVGIRITSATPSRVVGELDIDSDHLSTRSGRVHGGVLMAFADTLGAAGTVLNLGPRCRTTTIESKTNFFRSATIGRLEAVAVPLHIGRTTQVWRTDILDSGGQLLATVTQTQIVLAVEEPAAVEPSREPVGPSEGQFHAPRSEVESVPNQRRRKVFEAASEVFGRRGFASASVREIAAAAGMPVPTMYQYFRSKEEILSLVFETYMNEIARRLREAAQKEAATSRERLSAVIRVNLEMYDRYRAQIRLMYQETRSLGPEKQARALSQTRLANAIWGELIREGIESGEFDPVEPEVVANFIPMLCATWVLRRWNMRDVSLECLTEVLVNFILGGLSGRRVRR